MKTFFGRLASGWHLTRVVRLGIGIMAAVEAVRAHDYIIGALSAIFLYQAVTDTGCCGAAGCVIRPGTQSRQKIEDIDHEEIK